MHPRIPQNYFRTLAIRSLRREARIPPTPLRKRMTELGSGVTTTFRVPELKGLDERYVPAVRNAPVGNTKKFSIWLVSTTPNVLLKRLPPGLNSTAGIVEETKQLVHEINWEARICVSPLTGPWLENSNPTESPSPPGAELTPEKV